MKRISIIFLGLLIVNLLFAQTEKVVEKTFDDVSKIELDLVLGDCEISRGTDSKVKVRLTYSHSEDYFEPSFRFSDGRLLLEEHFNGKNGEGDSYWVLEVPNGLDIEFESATGNLVVSNLETELDGSSGTGNIELSNSSGEFDLNSGTGNIKVKDSKGEFELNSGTGRVSLENCEGEFDANSGTGKVEAENIVVDIEGEFNSGTGEVTVIAPSGDDFTMEINSGTNDAVLNMKGKKLEGYFELKADSRSGKIRSSVKFDKEEELNEGDSKTIKKSVTFGKSTPKYYISTGTGSAELKK
jgi:hypothetical protein